MAEITCLLPSTLGIDEHRQITAQSHRVHGLEEKGTMPTEQILHIVFGRHDQDIDPGLVHQTIQPIRVEGNGPCDLFDDVEHERSSLWTDCSGLCRDCAWRPWPLRIIYQGSAIGPCLRLTANAPCWRSSWPDVAPNPLPISVLIARIEAIEHTKISRPIRGAAA